MEIINQIDESFKFENKEIRIIGSYNEPYFVAKDICNVLGLSNITEALKSIPQKWKKIENLTSVSLKSDIMYQEQGRNMIILSEPAVYKLIMRSNKAIAQKFQEVVCEDILPAIRKKGEFKLKELIEEKEKIIKIKEEENKYLQDKFVNRQNRVQYKDKNCIYILTSDVHLEKRIYIIGESVDLTHRLTSYNKTLEHHVIYVKSCKSIEHMHVVEKMVLYKLDKYREKANRDRFILPLDKDISFFINIINKAIEWFEDIEEYVHNYTEEEIVLSAEELQEKYTQSIIEHEQDLKSKKSESNMIYRENNKEKKSEMDRLYREENREKIADHKKEYYEKNKTEILSKQKEHYQENKTEMLEKQKEYHTANKDIINQVRKIYRVENRENILKQKKIYREKYKEKINKKQNEIRRDKDNPLVECECGIKLKLITSKSKRHLNSKAHVKYIEDKNKNIKIE